MRRRGRIRSSRVAVDISVVIPTFRRPREVVEAIRSALGQGGVEIEIIVVDDCPDGSAEAAIRSVGDERVAYLRNPAPTGGRPGAVRNIGLPRGNRRFVPFLDADGH